MKVFCFYFRWKYCGDWRIRPGCSVKKLFVQISQNSQENICTGVCFQPTTLLKKRIRHMCFSKNFTKSLRTPFCITTANGSFCTIDLTKLELVNQIPIYWTMQHKKLMCILRYYLSFFFLNLHLSRWYLSEISKTLNSYSSKTLNLKRLRTLPKPSTISAKSVNYRCLTGP